LARAPRHLTTDHEKGTTVLKITRLFGSDRLRTIKLEGEILEPWVGAIRLACACRGPRSKRRLLDLSSVTFADAAGAQLLRDLRRHGVEIGACSAYVRELLKGGDS
jgi:anti-anti-sigma regulatory factor